MDDELHKLRERLAVEEGNLQQKSGKGVMFSTNGPVSIGLVKARIDVVEAQAAEIKKLKERQ